VRLQKYIAQAGVASRRAAEELIVRGKVRVNGTVVRELGTLVEQSDRVEVNGARVRPNAAQTYLMLHKPVNVVTTMRDPQGRRTVAHLVPKGTARVVPVGRLDYDSSGLLLLTNDGELAHRLTHPRFGVEKTYRAVVRGPVKREELDGLRARVRVIAARNATSVLDISIREGKNRQVRRMLEGIGHPVLSLQRLRFGSLKLGSLEPGKSRPLNARELSMLRQVSKGRSS